MNEPHASPTGELTGASLQSPPRSPRRILVVDDDDVIRRLNATMLQRFGYAVDAAADGADGWEALNTDRYDLLITDNDMPNVSGIELLKKLRTARMTLPVIMVTGKLPAAEFAQHPWLQPDAVLLKPFVITEFLDTVQQVLQVTCDACERTASPLDWQSRRATSGSRL